MLDSADVSAVKAKENEDLMRLRIEMEVEKTWLPWIGRKIRKAVTLGNHATRVFVTTWFKSSDYEFRVQCEVVRRLRALGYRVTLVEYGEIALDWSGRTET